MRLIGRVVENQLLTAALVVDVIVAVAGDCCADVVVVADVLAIDVVVFTVFIIVAVATVVK